MTSRAQRDFYQNDTESVAKGLLGQRLICVADGILTAGRIVETEAYLPEGDSACHAAKSRTARTEVMFGRAGLAYVYPIHAKFCFNIVTESEEIGCAVLIRALEPLLGIEEMRARRGVESLKRLTTGPACLCQALGIDRSVNGIDLIDSDHIWVEHDERLSEQAMVTTERIGVTSAHDLLLRFAVAGNGFVSGPARMR